MVVEKEINTIYFSDWVAEWFEDHHLMSKDDFNFIFRRAMENKK